MLATLALFFQILLPATFASNVEISDDFTKEEKAFVERIRARAWDLILQESVERCTLRRRNKWLYSQVVLDLYLGFNNDGSFFSRNMSALRDASNKGTFPDMLIQGYYAKDYTWALGDLNLVQTFSTGPKGKFVIQLNRYHLDEGDVLGWASVVGHEMLHNMGHLHPRLEDDANAYNNDLEINAYQSCIKSEGSAPTNHFALTYRCGGRTR